MTTARAMIGWDSRLMATAPAGRPPKINRAPAVRHAVSAYAAALMTLEGWGRGDSVANLPDAKLTMRPGVGHLGPCEFLPEMLGELLPSPKREPR